MKARAPQTVIRPDYRQFRLRKLNTPEFSHIKLLLFWPVFGLAFLALERFRPHAAYHVMHCALDDAIPFSEWALIPYLLWFVYLIGALAYLKYGPSEKNNVNANTSGVAALLRTAEQLTPRYRNDVCFLFLDGGSDNMRGAKGFRKRYPSAKEKPALCLDCVGSGDELLILPGKMSRWNDKLLDTILEQFSNSEKKTCFLKTDGLVHYPSDNRAFTGGTVICACKKVKGFGRCILPRKATGIDEENLSLLCDGLCKLVMYYNPQNT